MGTAFTNAITIFWTDGIRSRTWLKAQTTYGGFTAKPGAAIGSRGSLMRTENRNDRWCWSGKRGKKRKAGRGSGRNAALRA